MEEKNMVRASSEDGGVVFCGVDSTALVQRMEQIHHTGAVASAALGRLLTAASMMGIMLKSPDDSITLRVKGDGPLGMLIAVTDGMGCVKGCVSHPLVDLPPRADGHLDVGTAVGRNGTLSVVRDLGRASRMWGRSHWFPVKLRRTLPRIMPPANRSPAPAPWVFWSIRI